MAHAFTFFRIDDLRSFLEHAVGAPVLVAMLGDREKGAASETLQYDAQDYISIYLLLLYGKISGGVVWYESDSLPLTVFFDDLRVMYDLDVMAFHDGKKEIALPKGTLRIDVFGYFATMLFQEPLQRTPGASFVGFPAAVYVATKKILRQ